MELSRRRAGKLIPILILSALIALLALSACGSSNASSSAAPSDEESGASALSSTSSQTEKSLISSISYQQGEENDLVHISYDQQGNPTQAILTEHDGAQSDSVTTQNYSYDAQGNLSKIDMNLDGSPITGTGASSSLEQTAEGSVLTETSQYETADQGDTVALASATNKVSYNADGAVTSVELTLDYEGSDAVKSVVQTWNFDSEGLISGYSYVTHKADGSTETKTSFVGSLEVQGDDSYLVLTDQKDNKTHRLRLSYENGLLTSMSEGGDGLQVTIEYEPAPEATDQNLAFNKVIPQLYLTE